MARSQELGNDQSILHDTFTTSLRLVHSVWSNIIISTLIYELSWQARSKNYLEVFSFGNVLKFQRKRCDVPKKRGMHAATQGSKTYKLPIATQVEPETRTDGQAERALSGGCVLLECGRVTFQLRIGCVRKSCMLVACCLRFGCVQGICKWRAYGTAAC